MHIKLSRKKASSVVSLLRNDSHDIKIEPAIKKMVNDPSKTLVSLPKFLLNFTDLAVSFFRDYVNFTVLVLFYKVVSES